MTINWEEVSGKIQRPSDNDKPRTTSELNHQRNMLDRDRIVKFTEQGQVAAIHKKQKQGEEERVRVDESIELKSVTVENKPLTKTQLDQKRKLIQ